MPQNRKIINPQKGDIVRSNQGRDRFRVFMVIDIDYGNMVAPYIIADGKKHKITEKKHKNPRHLKLVAEYSKINTKIDFNSLTDVQVSEICEKYDI